MLRKSTFPGHWRLRRNFVFEALADVVVLLASFAGAQNQKAQPGSKAAAGGEVSRGKYIVEGVARCGQCHSPREADGSPDRAHPLQGAPVPWTPSRPDPNWPLTAPRIGGTPLPASDADMIKLLMTGIWTTGNHLRSPMPEFRLNRGDAEAVVAYLKSVNAQP